MPQTILLKQCAVQIIPIKVWNRIDILQQPIAAVAKASDTKRKRWVAIYCDVNRKSIVVYPPHLYCITDTEFDTALLERYAEDGNEDLAIVSQTNHYAADTIGLYALLITLEIDPESFDAPWLVKYPLL